MTVMPGGDKGGPTQSAVRRGKLGDSPGPEAQRVHSALLRGQEHELQVCFLLLESQTQH